MAVIQDWQAGKALQDRLLYMLDNQLICDVTFLVGPDEIPLKAHKIMMASASPVFYRMFYGPIPEQDIVKIPDIEVNHFSDILKFVYTDDIEIISKNLIGLLYCSEKYMLHTIKEKCNQYLTSHVDDEHACVVFQVAFDYQMDDLKKTALNYILQNGSSCLRSQTFLSLSLECLKIIIESDDLKCKENNVYQRTVDWAMAECKRNVLCSSTMNIRAVLKDAFYLIRFPIIKKKFFAKIVKSEILTHDELITIFCSDDDEPNNIFSSKQRQPEHLCLQDLKISRCNLDKNGSWNHAGERDCIDFKINENCYMVGIFVFGSKSYTGQHDITLELLQSSVVLNSTTQNLHSIHGKEIYPIKFAHPSKILQNTRYTISLIMIGPKVFSGENYRTKINASNLSVTILPPSQTSDNNTSVSNGQIPCIIFKTEKTLR